MAVADGSPMERVRPLDSGEAPVVVEPLLEGRGDGGRLRAALCEAVQKLGFERFVFSRRNRLTRGIGSNWSCWGTHPSEWASLSRARNYAAIEPIRRSAYRAAVPMLWDQNRFRADSGARDYFSDAASFGICSGVSMAVYTGHRGYVDFFDVYASTKALTKAHTKEVVRSLTDLWALGAYGHRLLPPDALGHPLATTFRSFSSRRARR
jgi:hypothetical protein